MRLASAVVLGGLTLALTWGGLWPFSLLVAAVTLVVVWEWGRVVRGAAFDRVYWASAAVIVTTTVLAAAGWPRLALTILVAGAVAIALAAPQSDGKWAAAGVLYAGLAALALVWFRSGREHGFEALVFLLLIVWGADSGAYVFGRSIGGPKLWALISPNKTWAGLAGAILVGSITAWWFASWVMAANAPRSAAVGALLALISQCGDLIESAIKRRHGVKDASYLIPGHGGFMDRVDGLIFAAVAAAIYALLVDWGAPAAALLSLRS